MSDRLEQFIKDNRDAFDSDEPGSQLWKKLQEQVRGAQKDVRIFHLNFLRWTAAAAILIMLGGMFYYMQKQNVEQGMTRTSSVPDKTTDQVMNEMDPAYAKEVYHFTQLIEIKQNELKQIEKEHPELYNQFVRDIHKLDSSYQALKTELPKNPNRELLLEAMIQNLQLQTELLNQQLQIIKQLKNRKNNENISKNI